MERGWTKLSWIGTCYHRRWVTDIGILISRADGRIIIYSSWPAAGGPFDEGGLLK